MLKNNDVQKQKQKSHSSILCNNSKCVCEAMYSLIPTFVKNKIVNAVKQHIIMAIVYIVHIILSLLIQILFLTQNMGT